MSHWRQPRLSVTGAGGFLLVLSVVAWAALVGMFAVVLS